MENMHLNEGHQPAAFLSWRSSEGARGSLTPLKGRQEPSNNDSARSQHSYPHFKCNSGPHWYFLWFVAIHIIYVVESLPNIRINVIYTHSKRR